MSGARKRNPAAAGLKAWYMRALGRDDIFVRPKRPKCRHRTDLDKQARMGKKARHEYRLENTEVTRMPVIYLAPLQGITDRVYRNLFAVYFNGVDLALTPFIPSHKKMKKKKGDKK